MPPLQRIETRRSLASWWSDSNSMLRNSPTINIHAAAKPLMKLMYHRQALQIIQENRDTPLSEELMEVYLTYVSCKYVSSRTKIVVWNNLCETAVRHRDQTQSYPHLLQLPLREITDISNILRTEPDDEIVIQVISALTTPDEHQKGVGTIVPFLLDSQSSKVRIKTCNLIATSAQNGSLELSILGISTFERVVDFLGVTNDSMVSNAILALTEMSRHPDGAAAVLSTKILEYLPIIIDLDDPQPACSLILTVAEHDPDFILAAKRQIHSEKLRDVLRIRCVQVALLREHS